MASNPLISILVTAHSEGLVAHKTMLSIFDAATLLAKRGIGYEVLVHVDNGDDATVEYFARYDDTPHLRVFQNEFGDLGLSRNFLLEQASGQYVSFLDADDLISRNWLAGALLALENDPAETIVHPAAILSFYHASATPPVVWLQRPSFDKDLDAKVLLGHNRWASVFVAPRTLLLRFPYHPTEDGIGYEDWSFNSATVAANVHHAIAPETVMFYRKRDESLLSQSNLQHFIQPYSDLFDILQINADQRARHGSSNGAPRRPHALANAYRAMSAGRRFVGSKPALRRIAKRPYEALVRDRRLKQLRSRVPQYVVDAWADIHSIERQLYPTIGAQFSVVSYDSDSPSIGEIFQRLVAKVTALPDYVFLVPWIVPGGADQVLLNYVDALKEIHPEWSLAVIGTLPSKNPWLKRLPASVPYLDFGNLAIALSEEDRDLLMSRLIVQLETKRLHIINSEFAYQWVNHHRNYLTGHGHVVTASVFCYTVRADTHGLGTAGYDDPLLRDVDPVIANVFTDNATFIDDLVQKDGIDLAKCHTHYQPTDLTRMAPPKTIDQAKPLRILWASRITEQKRPDLLLDIAKRLDPAKVHISVFGNSEPDFDLRALQRIKTITYEGGFAGSTSLPTDTHDVFLYTASIDGLPNAILEMAAAGLPIIASAAGGIGEFIIDGDTGLLVDPLDDVQAYVEAIEYLASHPDVARNLATNAQNLLKKRHNWQAFVDAIRDDFA